MSGSFFGFDTDLPPFGGKSGDLMGNDLMEAPEEEEEFDLMNDETFGDVDAGGDWEQEHEHLLESEVYRKDPNSTQDSGFNTGEKKFRGHVSSIQESLEQSLSQLVVEDDDDLVDPAIMNVSKSRPIPVKQQSLDELFGPSSPPGFLNTENLVSPGKQNIWGSPVKDSYMPKRENGLQSLLHVLQSGKSKTFQDSQIPGIQKPMSSSLPSAHDLTSSTVSALHGQSVRDSMNGMGDAKPRALTVQELERELRSEAPLPANHMRTPHHPATASANSNLPLPIGTPPRSHFMHQVPQRQPERQEVPAPPPMQTRVSPPLGPFGMHRVSPPVGVQNQSYQQIGRSPNQMNLYSSPIPGRGMKERGSFSTPDNHRMPHPMPYSDPTHQRGRGNYPQSQIRGRGIWNRGDYQHNQGRGDYQNRRDYPSRGNFSNRGDYHNQRGDYHNQRGDYHDYHNQRGDYQRNGDYQNYGNRSFQHREHHDRWERGDRSHNYHHGDHYGYQRDDHDLDNYYQQGDQYREQDMDNEDDFAYLMTQKEKDWIIKIQLKQLQTDNPYLDDYYYTTYSMKKLAMQQRSSDGVQSNRKNTDAKLVLPQLAKVETRSYKPAQFEGSLGKLTTSSVHNPRQIIDKIASITGSEEKGPAKDFRKFKQLLLDIEKLYSLLLDIDDTEKKVLALPEDAREPLLAERHRLTMTLYEKLQCDQHNSDHFLCVMSIRKGKKLVARGLSLFDKIQVNCIVSWVFENLVTVEKRDVNDHCLHQLYQPVTSIIKSCDLSDLLIFSQKLTSGLSQINSNLQTVLSYKFSCSVVVALLCQAEVVFTSTSPVDLDSDKEDQWVQFVKSLAEELSHTPDNTLTKPLELKPQLLAHMERCLNTDVFLQIEKKIQFLTEIGE